VEEAKALQIRLNSLIGVNILFLLYTFILIYQFGEDEIFQIGHVFDEPMVSHCFATVFFNYAPASLLKMLYGSSPKLNTRHSL
jgi:hypothetical protein